MRRVTLWDEHPVLAGVIAIAAIGAALLLLNEFVLPWVDHLSAVAAAATKRWMARP
jgi:hypothetical protein